MARPQGIVIVYRNTTSQIRFLLRFIEAISHKVFSRPVINATAI